MSNRLQRHLSVISSPQNRTAQGQAQFFSHFQTRFQTILLMFTDVKVIPGFKIHLKGKEIMSLNFLTEFYGNKFVSLVLAE